VPRPLKNLMPLRLPPEPDPDLWPRKITKRQTEVIFCHYFTQSSGQAVFDTWELVWIEIGGRLVTDTRDFLTEAARRLDSAPVHRRGRASTPAAAPAEARTT
jgi:hypothetical protein